MNLVMIFTRLILSRTCPYKYQFSLYENLPCFLFFFFTCIWLFGQFYSKYDYIRNVNTFFDKASNWRSSHCEELFQSPLFFVFSVNVVCVPFFCFNFLFSFFAECRYVCNYAGETVDQCWCLKHKALIYMLQQMEGKNKRR